MFTGIIEETGIVESLINDKGGLIIKIRAQKVLEGTVIGDSIAVNGVCLTVTEISKNTLTFFVMNETASKTNLKIIKAGTRLNLERAATLNTRLGGHLVSGHIDGTSLISAITKDGDALIYSIVSGAEFAKYIIYKGSVAVDGISLTVMYIDNSCFKVSIIPHTQAATTLTDRRVGDMVNIECDIVGKYVEKFLEKTTNEPKINMDFLRENGF